MNQSLHRHMQIKVTQQSHFWEKALDSNFLVKQFLIIKGGMYARYPKGACFVMERSIVNILLNELWWNEAAGKPGPLTFYQGEDVSLGLW